MPLNGTQIKQLQAAIADYAFPAAYFDFRANAPGVGLSMSQVEVGIRSDLLAGLPSRTKDGLSNVLYWGFAQMGGLAHIRVARFRDQVSQSQLQAATDLFSRMSQPALTEIKKLDLPQFSGVSFVSKVRMFLDPTVSATLDQQIMKIDDVMPGTVLGAVRRYQTTIPVTQGNAVAYEAWCDRLSYIRTAYLSDSARVVDVERGLFCLIQQGHVAVAARLLADA